ncbi:hypothetical protein [Pelagicoccus albus]|uniref:GYF domain-containing protein n=1 Tax=Pelagicoccus albus TaxID=415222 RepID=A0A7X1B9K8_9BACT|nr:hypothetical protein [Pelagicoccus albus]MBC2608217.1 hypothetical protein [Pelagicoccus albus]
MREYYIRREGDEDASGPFDIDQISSLIEANKLDANAYFYDIETESWLLISSNEELMETLFPPKRKLTLRTKESEEEKRRLEEEAAAKEAAENNAEEETTEGDSGEKVEKDPSADEEKKEKRKLKKDEEQEKPSKLDVTQMLAQAEGRTADPSGKSPREKQAAVAFFGLRFLTLFFLCSALAMGYLEKDLVMTADALVMVKSPYLILGAFDLIMVVVLILQVTEIYPLLRFRAAIGAGLLTLLFWASSDPILLISNLMLMTAIYFSSAIIKIRFLIACTILGLGGILGYVYVFFLA